MPCWPVDAPRFLLATSGAANAGIDSSDVNGVYRLDFPPSLLDLAQGKGRAGHVPGASPASALLAFSEIQRQMLSHGGN